MKKSIIFIKKDYYTYDGKKYDFNEFREVSGLLSSKIKVIILQEELFVSHFENSVRRHELCNFVDSKIRNDFPQNGDILYDFEKKRNIISIYSIKGSKRVEKIVEKAINIEIKPIQFVIRDVLMKMVKDNDRNFRALIKYDTYYYYVSFRNGSYYDGFISENKCVVEKNLLKKDNLEEIYVDDNTFDIISDNNKFKAKKVNIGEFIDENIYEKQKFCSREVF
ncbi:hypothetical protein [Clostridium beijerinckii]|uniref:hypothetical protein n=1 Tax=Clostridium beijerinckii TaxID=1520 RepID=UPI00047DB165|nr:hypothetical protein [Clostridium beijerinckii]